MNRNLLGILIILAGSLLISVPNIYAKTGTTAIVPFAFTVGQSEMPAGTFTITPVSDSAIVIRDSNAEKCVVSLILSEEAGRGDVAPKLVFNRYMSSHVTHTSLGRTELGAPTHTHVRRRQWRQQRVHQTFSLATSSSW
jgi:hypothetical protein